MTKPGTIKVVGEDTPLADVQALFNDRVILAKSVDDAAGATFDNNIVKSLIDRITELEAMIMAADDGEPVGINYHD